MNQLGLFAKFWEPGRVKTRLANDIGELAACQVYEAFVRHLLKKLSLVGDHRVLAFSPPERQPEFALAAGNAWATQPQTAGHLGDRMANFFSDCFANPGSEPAGNSSTEAQNPDHRDPNHVVLIGTDCPHLSQAIVDEAFSRLRQIDIVLGPCPDGGYFLVGMKQQHSAIFDDIQWSSPLVLQQTLEQCKKLNLNVSLLDELTDIDHLSDLLHVRTRIMESGTDRDKAFFKHIDNWLPSA